MPYQMHLPEGSEAAQHIFGHLGTPKLVESRWAIFKTIYDAVETNITLREREAMRFPLTVVIGCPVCNSLRMWRDWPGYTGEPIPEEFYKNAEIRNLNWPGFTVRERLLIGFVERFDTGIDTMNSDADFWDEFHANFTETELGDVVILAGAWLGFGRGLKALGVGSVCEIPAAVAAAK
jgi:hypothetical protein